MEDPDIPNMPDIRRMFDNQYGGAFERYGFDPRRALPYHPQTNGKVERAHRELGIYLRTYAQNSVRWDERIPSFVFSHNNACRDDEGYSPAFMMFGRELRTPFEARRDPITYSDANCRISKRVHDLRAARDAVEMAKIKREARNNRNREETYI